MDYDEKWEEIVELIKAGDEDRARVIFDVVSEKAEMYDDDILDD